ncbi:hypothetical protein Mp_4g07750 [Marchantia polymorpha subsp. ruderalis]|uniref:Uncharacterized protein n=2 Tax=Marchantia polymorpha TaxID=3197 RepID=A0AAF6B7J1_MARPO|nr:hypothetical protein MARPO_0115s0005 [Marchantia polymorpha]BBN07975.1 hypothetical protein Mp_4g07750 [Marchantia polymorpha subsp. ruderalis]|eukprot:PTQ31078.1 hypothetical protein MARPO_0115s0005 [Marchantia polymorpha]
MIVSADSLALVFDCLCSICKTQRRCGRLTFWSAHVTLLYWCARRGGDGKLVRATIKC